MPYVMPKPFTESKMVRFNGLLLAFATFLAAAPETMQQPQIAAVIAMLPEHWRRVIASVIAVVAALNLILRLFTKGPVNLPGASK
jgi:hypothetical protein